MNGVEGKGGTRSAPLKVILCSTILLNKVNMFGNEDSHITLIANHMFTVCM